MLTNELRRAIILAAGIGSRLRPITDRMPKCLVPINEQPILGWQIEALLAAEIQEILVVAGYRAADVVAYCAQWPKVKVMVNREFATTNNMYSYFLATVQAPSSDLILCNGDVVFAPEVIRRLTNDRRPNLIGVERGVYSAESMKVTVDQSTGKVTRISKDVVEADAFAVSIDVYKFGREAASTLTQAAKRWIEVQGERQLWTEVAIQEALTENSVFVCELNGLPWMEIDTVDDLSQANRLFLNARS